MSPSSSLNSNRADCTADAGDLEKVSEKGCENSASDKQYPSMRVVVPTMICISLAFFLAALDRTIVGVAVPAITNDFQSFNDISWYQAAFTLTNCVFQLPMGKIYKFFPAKWTIVTNVVLFEIGSIICASAPSSIAFILGRAITGIGAAGIVVGAQVIVRDLLPLEKRPKYQGFLGATFGLSSILGPLVGGAFTTNVSWRWCFWISVPIGGISLAGLMLLLPRPKSSKKLEGSALEVLKRFDPIGNLFLFPGVICILLALQWGGVLYTWRDARIITLLVLGSVLLVGFAAVQVWIQENGTIPPRIIQQRTIASGTIVSLGIGGVLVISGFYLPIWFQAIQGLSAGSAGIRLLPYFLSTVIFTIATGIIISRIGYYTPVLVIGCAISMVGTGLLTTFRTNTTTGEWIGYQIVLGASLGLSLQQPFTAAQTVLADEDVPTGVTILTFTQSLGATVFVSASQAILSHTLSSRHSESLPGFDASVVARTGVTDLRNMVAQSQQSVLFEAYNSGIVNVFFCALAAAALTMIASLFFEWKTVRKQPEGASN
ncbi:MFS transporter-like protein 66 [Elsinoe australis]|uniref:MFS transporter-like protein 66 n=1 Tax=Elsinoe australis TaxID=40998 RepID=A0A4U7B769_9PEZI|nr:MFS transporter-like protein 66 [Elsinoe australis]